MHPPFGHAERYVSPTQLLGAITVVLVVGACVLLTTWLVLRQPSPERGTYPERHSHGETH